MEFSFTKYQGCGNDFILIDNRSHTFPSHNSQLIQRLCVRQFGIGADGIILLESSQKADFRMRIFNADGSEAEMCGNGARCIVHFAHQLGWTKTHFTIETMERLLTASLSDQNVTIDMGKPQEMQWSIALEIEDIPLTLHHINTGVPHAILFVENLDDPKWMQLAPSIRSHPRFPNGANVNFAQFVQNEIWVRTYERGVEGETLACGTGATAVAIAAIQLYQTPAPVSIRTRSGDRLRIQLPNSSALMEGPVASTFTGKFRLNGENFPY